jgi:hypothetical protein
VNGRVPSASDKLTSALGALAGNTLLGTQLEGEHARATDAVSGGVHIATAHPIHAMALRIRYEP